MLSPSRSPMATDKGPSPTPWLAAAAKEPWPVPRSIETVSETLFATARSGALSPSRSPMATE